MSSIFHSTALVLSGLFAGGAMMQTIVDHPARVSADKPCAVSQMQRSLERVDPYMPALATLAAAAGIGSFFTGGTFGDLVAAGLFFAIGIHTFALIIPINKQIMSISPIHGDVAAAHRLMKRWGFLHAFRSMAGTSALILFATS